MNLPLATREVEELLGNVLHPHISVVNHQPVLEKSVESKVVGDYNQAASDQGKRASSIYFSS
jgi:hypothetical protein